MEKKEAHEGSKRENQEVRNKGKGSQGREGRKLRKEGKTEERYKGMEEESTIDESRKKKRKKGRAESKEGRKEVK